MNACKISAVFLGVNSGTVDRHLLCSLVFSHKGSSVIYAILIQTLITVTLLCN